MKKLIPLFTLLLATTVALAADAPAAGKTHELEATVVSMDAAAKTITLKTADGDKTVPVMGAALDSMKSLKAGDKVTVTCQDDDKGAHQGVSGIKAAAAAPAK